MSAATLARLLPEVDACAGDLPGAVQPAAAGGAALQPLDLRETRAVIYTSGSGGQPIAIHKRLAQLDSEVQHLEQVFGAGMDAGGAPVIHATVSHQHIYGLLFVTTWPLAAGRLVEVDKIAYPGQMPAPARAFGAGLQPGAPAAVARHAGLGRGPDAGPRHLFLRWPATAGILAASPCPAGAIAAGSQLP